ncbi:hypothetical protein Vadar_026845 [Vaccinium darrowii]|uniref:Uncharacterized protein n=1 Tax=Vaccinium darrowii TaxID=229202 RepID=A0ACB7Y1U9_9ERIC|nr:hypothetical protein Vadar_026845 [Vaccinium darrowii]
MDAFILQKKSKRFFTKFGFVRFRSKKEAWDAIYEMNRLVIRGCKILVKMASFEASNANARENVLPEKAFPSKLQVNKGERKDGAFNPKVWNKGNPSFAEVVKGSNPTVSSIKLDDIGNEWLYWSATAKLLPSKSMALIQDHLANLGFLDIQVRPIGGGDYLILTFPTIESRDFVFNNGEFAWIKDWFLEIHKWSKSNVIPPRLIWLNCYGVPLHLWNSGTFIKLGKIWGNVIQISDDTVKGISFDVGKVLVSTRNMDMINKVVSVEN